MNFFRPLDDVAGVAIFMEDRHKLRFLSENDGIHFASFG